MLNICELGTILHLHLTCAMTSLKLNRLFATALCCAIVFSSQAQSWTSVSPLPDGFVSNHSFGFALNDMGYLVGGETTSGYSNAFYQYDPASDAWTALPDFPGEPRGYTIGDTWNGEAWFGFGQSNSGALNDLWVYNPETETWTEKASCPCSARTHPAFIAEAGKVFVGLGGGPSGDTNDWWEYDIASDSWSEKPDFPASERHHPYQFGIDGDVFVGFGHHAADIFNEWYKYEPATEVWTEMATLPAEGRVAGSQLAHNGMGYALSGDGDDHSSMETGELWQYDPEADAWNQWPSHPGMSRWAPASFIINDEMYLINGMSLDPGSFDYMETNWKFAMVPASATDMEVTSYLGEDIICTGDELPIIVRLTNMGANDFEAGNAMALTVQMTIDGEVVLSSDWSGSLSTFQSVDFTLGMYTFSGATDFTIEILASDENANNDSLDVSIATSPEATTQWAVELNTDNYGNETGWELRNALGALIDLANPGSYQGETSYEFTLSLPSTGCYTFTLTDSYGDGMFGSQWGGVNGSCTIRSLDANANPLNVIFDYDGSFVFDELSQTIDASNSLGISNAASDVPFSVQAFPNPFEDVIQIAMRGGVHDRHGPASMGYEVRDIQGRLIEQSTAQFAPGEILSLDASAWPSGALIIQWSLTNHTGSLQTFKR